MLENSRVMFKQTIFADTLLRHMQKLEIALNTNFSQNFERRKHFVLRA